jgi:hypothetical protein
MTALRGRHIGSLLTVWIAAMLLTGAMYWLQTVMPAFTEMVRPLYVVLGLILIVTTWKWFRARANNYDRRHTD